MKIKLVLLWILLMGMATLLSAQTPFTSPAVANSLYLQRVSDGVWDGTIREGTLTLNNFATHTHYVVKFDELAGAVFDTTKFNAAWARSEAAVEAVLSTETYNARLMLSAPQLAGNSATYQAQVLDFVDTTQEARALDGAFGVASLTLLPSAPFVQLLNAVDADLRVIPQSDQQFITALYLISSASATYDASTNTLRLAGVNGATHTIGEIISTLDTPALARFWVIAQADRTFALPAVMAFGADYRRLTVFNPVFDEASNTLVYTVSDVQEGLPANVDNATLTILTGTQFSTTLAQIAAAEMAGTRSTGCEDARVELEDANAVFMALVASYPDYDASDPLSPLPADPDLIEAVKQLGIAQAEVNRLCGAQTTADVVD